MEDNDEIVIAEERRKADLEAQRHYRIMIFIYLGCLLFSSGALILAIVSLTMRLAR